MMTQLHGSDRMSTQPLSPYNIIGYGLGDMANNFAFSMCLLFLLNYYTDVVGISAAVAGTLLAVVRVYDAVMDVVAGRIVDRTVTRWGRFRPFLLWGAIPLMALSVAVFSVPAGWGMTAKTIYAGTTYALLGTAFAFVNIAYGSLSTVMTQVPRERSWLGAARMIVTAGTMSFLALVLAPMLQNAKGEALQSQLTRLTLVLAVLGTALYVLCFFATREVVERRVEKPAWKLSVSTILINRPLHILCLVVFFLLAGGISTKVSTIYYARFVLGDVKLFPVIILVTTLFSTLIAAPLVPALVVRIGKRATFMIGSALASVAYFTLYLGLSTGRFWVFGLFAVGAIGYMMATTVLWALEGDTVEYGEWRSGVRTEGLSYSVFSFARKCGQALGGSVPAFLLAAGGYLPNALVQNDATLEAIKQGATLVPALAFMVALVVMYFYPLTDRRFIELLEEIRLRRA